MTSQITSRVVNHTHYCQDCDHNTDCWDPDCFMWSGLTQKCGICGGFSNSQPSRKA